jgi:[protein]-arginine 3-hydroxylase / protease
MAQDSGRHAGSVVRPLPRIAGLSQSEFRRQWVAPRRPAVFAGLVSDWPAVRRWSLDFLQRAYPAVSITTAQVAAGAVVMHRRRGLIHESERFDTFITALRAGARERYLMSPLHELPEGLTADAPPPAYLSGTKLQNAKLWIGPSGIVSSLHRDLADNLHAQVSGRKRFTLVAPQQSACVYPNSFFDGVPNGCRVDIEHPDYAHFPRLREAEMFVGELGPGDVIYVPRGWWHHVRTLELSISVNFWWARGVRRLLVQSADYVKRLRHISR